MGGGGDYIIVEAKPPAQKVDEPMFIKVGPGGWDDKDCEKWDGRGHSTITQIFISYKIDAWGSIITSFQYQYVDEDGNLKLSPSYGKHKGTNFHVVTLEKTEYITRITGFHDKCFTKIRTLKFETNVREYGPFGINPDHHANFKFEFGPHSRVGGFFGGYSPSRGCITSFGAYMMPMESKKE